MQVGTANRRIVVGRSGINSALAVGREAGREKHCPRAVATIGVVEDGDAELLETLEHIFCIFLLSGAFLGDSQGLEIGASMAYGIGCR